LLIEIGELDVQPERINTQSDNLLLEYGFNSILTMRYLLRIEEEFGIEIDAEDLNGSLLNNFENLTSYVIDRL
jgi:acyl carrier protein